MSNKPSLSYKDILKTTNYLESTSGIDSSYHLNTKIDFNV